MWKNGPDKSVNQAVVGILDDGGAEEAKKHEDDYTYEGPAWEN